MSIINLIIKDDEINNNKNVRTMLLKIIKDIITISRERRHPHNLAQPILTSLFIVFHEAHRDLQKQEMVLFILWADRKETTYHSHFVRRR